MQLSVRRVPLSWEHPKKKSGEYFVQFDSSYTRECEWYNFRKERWVHEKVMTDCCHFKDIKEVEWRPIATKYIGKPFEHAYGDLAPRQIYRPDWYKEFCPGYQMYNARKHTPVSPVFSSAEKLALWSDLNVPYKDLLSIRSSPDDDREWLVKTIKSLWGLRVWYRPIEVVLN